jgi:hypothetical protein
MKKLIFFLFCLILILSCTAPIYAAGGSHTVTSSPSAATVGDIHYKIAITTTWVADDTSHLVPDCSLVAATYQLNGWTLYSVETDPGSPAPSDNYTVTITDANGLDITGGIMSANRDTANTEFKNMSDSANGYYIIRGNLTVSVSSNTTNSATGTIILVFTKI